jgi:predicted RNase H-like nuclease (RuvC/YqgF family)
MMSEYEAVAEVKIEELEGRIATQKAVIENLRETIASLKNEIEILQQIHGESCQGWSKYQKLSERCQAELRFIYGLADGALGLGLSRNQWAGIGKLIKRSAGSELPEFDDIPF